MGGGVGFSDPGITGGRPGGRGGGGGVPVGGGAGGGGGGGGGGGRARAGRKEGAAFLGGGDQTPFKAGAGASTQGQLLRPHNSHPSGIPARAGSGAQRRRSPLLGSTSAWRDRTPQGDQ